MTSLEHRREHLKFTGRILFFIGALLFVVTMTRVSTNVISLGDQQKKAINSRIDWQNDQRLLTCNYLFSQGTNDDVCTKPLLEHVK